MRVECRGQDRVAKTGVALKAAPLSLATPAFRAAGCCQGFLLVEIYFGLHRSYYCPNGITIERLPPRGIHTPAPLHIIAGESDRFAGSPERALHPTAGRIGRADRPRRARRSARFR